MIYWYVLTDVWNWTHYKNESENKLDIYIQNKFNFTVKCKQLENVDLITSFSKKGYEQKCLKFVDFSYESWLFIHEECCCLKFKFKLQLSRGHSITK